MKCRGTVLIAGTNEKSIGRIIAKRLHEEGYEIWLYGRNANKIDDDNWHERACDITNSSLNSLSLEIQTPNIIIFSADSGTGKGDLENITTEDIRKFIESKIIGSLNLLKMIIDKNPERKIIAIWLGGSISNKPKHLILYSLVNAGLNSLVNELNKFYGNILNAYYLETPLVLPSTLGDSYINKYGNTSRVAQRPEEVAQRVIKLINNAVSPGFIRLKNQKMRL